MINAGKGQPFYEALLEGVIDYDAPGLVRTCIPPALLVPDYPA